MFINPYDLLGVTIDSTSDEIKKSYYKLALLCHEDKGGNKDDMIAVHSAYKFILREISNINRTLTVEIIENNFKDFCDKQKEAVPKFVDIYAEAFDLPKFNAYFAETAEGMIPSSIIGGYGDLMEKSCYHVKTDYSSEDKGSLTNAFNTELSIYKSPQETIAGPNNIVDYTELNKSVENYSTVTDNGLSMSDYKEAFSVDNNMIIKEQPNDRTLEQLLDEREKINNVEKTQYVWSFSGLLDGAGKRIKDYLKLF